MNSFLAQVTTSVSTTGDAGVGIVGSVVWLVVTVAMIVAIWKLFTKAGQPGWASLIPIYNTIVLLQIAGKPVWWFLLLFIPVVNIVIAVLVMIGVAKAFGKGTGFALGLLFLSPIFVPILGFSDAKYIGSPA